MDSPSLKVQCQAALALRNLASDGRALLSVTLYTGLKSIFREISVGDCEG